MSRTRTRVAAIAGIVGAAALGMGHTAMAEPVTDSTWSTTDTSVLATYGTATFEPYGEHLYACDTRKDGLWVKAQLKGRASVTDGNGAKAGCGHKNLSIAEGTTVYLRLCVESHGCSAWVKMKA